MIFSLSSEELFFVSALMGADNLWGLPDPFRDLAVSEVSFELLRLQEQLIRKRLIEARPDGHLFPRKELAIMMRHCIQSGKVYIFNSSLAESENTRLRFFEHAGAFIRYSFRGEAELSQVDGNLAIQEVNALFGDTGPLKEPGCSFVIGVTRLRHMGSLSRKHFLLELRKCGCEEPLASQIAESLQGQSDFCSLLAYERSDGTETLKGKLVALRSAGGDLLITPDCRNLEKVCISRLNGDKLHGSLEDIFGIQTEVTAI